MRVLLSIKPRFANSIFDGNKKFEYRRAIFRENITHVVVYASSPVRMVIGEFKVDDVLFDDIVPLWNRTRAEAGISEGIFYSYFSEKQKGYAIKIVDAVLYDEPASLQNFNMTRPPQSFAYLRSEIL